MGSFDLFSVNTFRKTITDSRSLTRTEFLHDKRTRHFGSDISHVEKRHSIAEFRGGHSDVFCHTGRRCVANVGAVEVGCEENNRHNWGDPKVQFACELGFSFGVDEEVLRADVAVLHVGCGGFVLLHAAGGFDVGLTASWGVQRLFRIEQGVLMIGRRINQDSQKYQDDCSLLDGDVQQVKYPTKLRIANKALIALHCLSRAHHAFQDLKM